MTSQTSFPDGAYGVEQDAAILVLLHKEMEDSNAEVEPIQDGVSREKDANEDEPDDVQIQEMKELVHGQ